MYVFLMSYYFNLSLFSILIVTIASHFLVFDIYDLITYLFNLFIKFPTPYYMYKNFYKFVELY